MINTTSLNPKKSTSRSLWKESFGRLFKNPGAVAGMIILTIFILAAVFAPSLTSFNPLKGNSKERLKPPSVQYIAGTDSFGRDIFTRLIYGGRISLRVGVVCVLISFSIGVPLGLIAGYFGGWADSLIMRCIDILLAFPGILSALVITAILGPNLFNVMIAVGISAVPTFARVCRSSVLKVKEEVYVEAARCVGAHSMRILWFHIFPNVIGSLIVVATIGIAGAIISATALSFLGIGAIPPTPEWGLQLNEGRQYLRHAPWMCTYPGLAIMLTVLSINLIGDGLRDALDPKTKR